MAVIGLENNPTFQNTKKSSQFWSSKLLPYVEYVEIGGVKKTVFFTEKNTNFNVGDRAVIVNGVYDSNKNLQQNKFARNADGWRVLACDGCRLILDIDWTGEPPYKPVVNDELINVWNVRSQREFDWINSQKIAINDLTWTNSITGLITPFPRGIYSKFSGTIINETEVSIGPNGNTNFGFNQIVSLIGNSIIWVPENYLGSAEPLFLNNGISGGSGFYMKLFGSNDWINVTNYVLTNKIRTINPSFELNGRLYVHGEDFSESGYQFRERIVHKYENSIWVNDNDYSPIFITKNNFRSGKFLGFHRDGIFGSYDKKLNFQNGKWSSGIFLNSRWISGQYTPRNVDEVTTISRLTGTSSPLQIRDFNNNGGYGWTYLIDSIFDTTFLGGVYENCNLGGPTQSDPIDGFYGVTQSYDVEMSFSKFKFCDVQNARLTNCLFENTNLKNSYIISSKVASSQVSKSVIDRNSEWDDRSGIKIESADIWSYWDLATNTNRGVLKLYISPDDYRKLEFGNVFYINKLNKDLFFNSLDENQRVQLPIETKWILENYFNASLPSVTDRIIVSLKSPKENLVSYLGVLQGGTNQNRFFTGIEKASIDIDCSKFGYYQNLDSVPRSIVYTNNFLLSPFNLENISKLFEGVSVADSEFNSGIFNDSFWRSGTHVNYQVNQIGPPSNITTISDDTLRINLRKSNLWTSNVGLDLEDKDLKIGDWVWLSDSIDGYVVTNTTTFDSCFNYLGNLGLSFSNWPGITAGDIVSITLDNGLTNPSYNGISTVLGIGPGLTPNLVIDKPFLLPDGGGTIKLLKLQSVGGRYKVSSISDSVNNIIRSVFLTTPDYNFVLGTQFNYGDTNTPTYISLHQSLINRSVIENGMFRRSLLVDNTIKNDEFDNGDVRLSSDNTSKLRLINIYFRNTNNSISNGLIYKSHFINESWKGGLIFNSIWDGGIFENGTFFKGYWKVGTFSDGFFTSNDSTQPTTYAFGSNYDYELNPNISYWQEGTFNGGEFYKSVWNKGDFNNGRFYFSDFYSGNFYNGLLGSNLIPENLTRFGSLLPLANSSTASFFYGGIVENALVGGLGDVYWFNGKFEKGTFTTENTGLSIWYNGDFLGGKITNNARWKGGKFYGGKFLSTWNWNLQPPVFSVDIEDYAWQGGEFFGGEFGNGELGANSNWYDGEFKGGVFRGRVWRNGVMDSGLFLGSGTHSIYDSPNSPSGEQNWVNSFKTNYYGFWVDGFVVNDITTWKTGEKVQSKTTRKTDEKRIEKRVLLQNILWKNGTFSHERGTIQNSVWMNGSFMDGTFDSSVFNPYVDRTFQNVSENASFSPTSSCVWLGGEFKSTLGTGSFYHSEWKRGNFRDGYMLGGIWRSGTFWYGKADNIFWENGRWKNGTWNSSPFDSTSLSSWTGTSSIYVIDGREKDSAILISNVSGSDYIHMNNVFSASQPDELLSDINITSIGTTGSVYIGSGETFSTVIRSTPTLTFVDFGTTATWSFGTTFSTIYGIGNDSHVYTDGGSWPPSYANPNLTPPSSKLWAWNGTTKDIFYQPNTVYQIDIRVGVDETPQVEIEFGVGGLDPQVLTLNSSPFGPQYTNVWDLTFMYSTTDELLNTFDEEGNQIGKQFYLRKRTSGILRILRLSITQKDIEYHPQYNNKLYSAISSGEINLPNDTRLVKIGASDNGNQVSLKWGNGIFKEGIWENGIWNDGWRSSEWFNTSDILACEGVVGIDGLTGTDVTYQTDSITWLIKLKFIPADETGRFADPSIVQVGDLVSVGNIVAIDVNENRRLITDALRIVSINTDTNILTLSYSTNFPVRRIVNDSPNHLVYLTKNIWMNGAFLNGFFRGVWNGGLFKGFPRITEMSDSHFIEGKFDGGHFISGSDLIPLSTNQFNTGLIQNFVFKDNNVGELNDKKYLSWMDINYLTFSRTNINKDSTIFKIVPLIEGTASFFVNERNLWGEPTLDILKSISTFRDIDTPILRNYSLGHSIKKYSNLMEDGGNFLKPFSTTYPQIGMSNFLNDPNDVTSPGLGWEYFDYVNTPTINSNISPINSRKLQISNFDQVMWTRYENVNITGGVLPNRYYMVEADLEFTTTDWVTYSPPPPGPFVAYQTTGTAVTLGLTTNIPPGGTSGGFYFNDPFEVVDEPFAWGQTIHFPKFGSETDPDNVWNLSLAEYVAPTSSISQYFVLDFSIEFPFPMDPELFNPQTGRKTNFQIIRDNNVSTSLIPTRGYPGAVEFRRISGGEYLIPNLTWSADYRLWSGTITTNTIGVAERNNAISQGLVSLGEALRPLNPGDRIYVGLEVVMSSKTVRDYLGLSWNQTNYTNPNFYYRLLPDTIAFTFSGSFSNVISTTVSVTTIPGITISNILTFDYFDEQTASAALYGGFTPSSTLGYNHLTDNQRVKREYFFNKSNLEMTTFHSNQNPDYKFGNISFWEVDMVPFFKYADDSQIDFSIKSPYYATAPKIDYNNNNFDFVGNISLTIDSQTVTTSQVGVGQVGVNFSQPQEVQIEILTEDM